MKISKSQLREIIKQEIREAAKEGAFQGYARNSFKRMIATASSGGNDNSPPFTKKPGKLGKSGPIVESMDKIKSRLNKELKKEDPETINKAKESIDDVFKQIGWEISQDTAEGAAWNKLINDEEELNSKEKSLLQKAAENWSIPYFGASLLFGGSIGLSIATLIYIMAVFMGVPSVEERIEMYKGNYWDEEEQEWKKGWGSA